MAGSSKAAAAPRDLSRRLTVFGLLSIAVGAGALALGLLNLALLALPVATMLAPGAPPPDWRPAVAGALTWVLLAAVFVWGGVGSMRCRRWSRSVMLTLAWTWLLVGAMTLALGWLMLDDVLALAAARSGQPLPPGFAGAFKAILMTLLAAGGVALPALFVWAYTDPDVLSTCEARHPEPDWTAACPLPVLGLSLGLAACGLLGLPLVFHAVVPFFGRIVTGVPAVLLVLGGAAACLWLARSTYRLEPVGWWGTVCFVVALGAAVGVTFTTVDVGEFLLVYGLPADGAAGMDGVAFAIVWGSVLLTIATVGYLLAIKQHFRG